jgi:hypothetical protein
LASLVFNHRKSLVGFKMMLNTKTRLTRLKWRLKNQHFGTCLIGSSNFKTGWKRIRNCWHDKLINPTLVCLDET